MHSRSFVECWFPAVLLLQQISVHQTNLFQMTQFPPGKIWFCLEYFCLIHRKCRFSSVYLSTHYKTIQAVVRNILQVTYVRLEKWSWAQHAIDPEASGEKNTVEHHRSQPQGINKILQQAHGLFRWKIISFNKGPLPPYNTYVCLWWKEYIHRSFCRKVSNTADCVAQHDLFCITQPDCVTEKSAGDVGGLQWMRAELRKQIFALRKIYSCKLVSVSTWS